MAIFLGGKKLQAEKVKHKKKAQIPLGLFFV
jgi:hypothetical protein